MSYVPGIWDSPVSYVPGSRKTWPADDPKQSQVPGSRNSLVYYVPGSLFLVFLTFKPMLQPLKQHSFQKLLNFSTYYTSTVQTYLKNFLNWRFSGQLPGVPSTGESFLNAYNLTNRQKNQNGCRTSLMGPGGVVWGKNREQKISWDCPFKESGEIVWWKTWGQKSRGTVS